MTNVTHASMSGSNVHEPKGIATATAGQVYVASGSSTGAWTSIDANAFTGMVADFVTPIAPTGWLELDGSDISTTTYATLYGLMSIQQAGSRVNGSPIVASLSSTANMKVGYFVFGTGIAAGTTILSVDSSTQITLSANATATNSTTLSVSPWYLASGTVRLPDTTTAGRFRRSRTSTSFIGTVQASQNLAHTHTATTDAGGAHTHTITDPTHIHSITPVMEAAVPGAGTFTSGGTNFTTVGTTAAAATGISINTSATHTHTLTSDSTGSTEARPVGLVFMTCVKT